MTRRNARRNALPVSDVTRVTNGAPDPTRPDPTHFSTYGYLSSSDRPAHEPAAVDAISAELVACTLGSRSRPELEASAGLAGMMNEISATYREFAEGIARALRPLALALSRFDLSALRDQVETVPRAAVADLPTLAGIPIIVDDAIPRGEVRIIRTDDLA